MLIFPMAFKKLLFFFLFLFFWGGWVDGVGLGVNLGM